VVTAKFNLKVNQLDARLEEILLQNIIYLKRIILDGFNFLPGRQLQGNCKIIINQRIAQLVILVAEFHGGLFKGGSLRHTESLGEASCCHIPDNHFKRYDFHFLYGGFSVAQFLDIMSRNPFFLQKLVHTVAHLIIDDAFSYNGALLLPVESGGIIFIIHN